MKENINILFLKNVGNYLDGENFKYLAVFIDDENYILKDLPIAFKGHMSALSEYLCYDYDELSDLNKRRYQNQYKALKKVNDNIYSVQTKTYVKLNNPSFT